MTTVAILSFFLFAYLTGRSGVPFYTSRRVASKHKKLTHTFFFSLNRHFNKIMKSHKRKVPKNGVII